MELGIKVRFKSGHYIGEIGVVSYIGDEMVHVSLLSATIIMSIDKIDELLEIIS